MSKSAVHRFYQRACESEHVNCVSRHTFVNIWNALCPYIASMKPATDLCHICQQNANIMMKSANMPESVKSWRLKNSQSHPDLARVQRQHYNDQCATAKDKLPESKAGPL